MESANAPCTEMIVGLVVERDVLSRTCVIGRPLTLAAVLLVAGIGNRPIDTLRATDWPRD